MAQDSDLVKLESDVKQMASKISEYRQTLPDHLKNTLDSVLSSHRPIIRSGSDPLPPSCLSIAETQQAHVLYGTEERDCGEKMIQLKERMLRNAASIPKDVKRVRECVESMENFDSLDRTIQKAKNQPTGIIISPQVYMLIG